MPDDLPPTPPPAEPPQPPITFDIGEEFGTAKKNLPPTRILIAAVIGLAVFFAIFSLLQRPKTTGKGSIGDIVSVEIPDQNAVMVAINVAFQNAGPKPFWIHSMKADLETTDKTYSDDAASASVFVRYSQAFPALNEHAPTPLKIEDKIPPGGSTQGTIVVSFPVNQDIFSKRKSLKVSIWPYDQAVPLVLTR